MILVLVVWIVAKEIRCRPLLGLHQSLSDCNSYRIVTTRTILVHQVACKLVKALLERHAIFVLTLLLE